jgi:hypothetical protein
MNPALLIHTIPRPAEVSDISDSGKAGENAQTRKPVYEQQITRKRY